MKMLAAHNLFQHNRLVRLIMIIIIVGLTIFLYTSYYANQTMQQLPSAQRLHVSSLISVSSISSDDINPFIQNNAISLNDKLVTNDGDSSSSTGLGSIGLFGSLNEQQTKQQMGNNFNNDNNNDISNSINNSNNNENNNNKLAPQNLAGK